MRTSRIRLGTAVLLGAMRHPVQLAQAIATVDVLSGGRTTVAMGVGRTVRPLERQQWATIGVTQRERGGRLVEVARILKKLWTQDHVSFQGRYFTLHDVTLEPKPLQPGGVPLLLATHHPTGDVQYRRAACYADGLIGISDSPDQLAQTVQRVAAHAQEEGRDHASLDTAFIITVNINPDRQERTEEAGAWVRRYFGVDFWKDREGPDGPPEVVAQRIREFAHAGAKTVILRFASQQPERQLDAFLTQVLPALRK